MSDRTCKTCSAYDKFKSTSIPPYPQTTGYCRAGPPMTHVVNIDRGGGVPNSEVETHFPWTSDDDWCLAHQTKAAPVATERVCAKCESPDCDGECMND